MDLKRQHSSDGEEEEQNPMKKIKLVSPVKSFRFDTMAQCRKLLTEFRTNQDMRSFTIFFQDPVDPVLHDIPHYFDVIKNPMDLRTMHEKFEANQYKDEDDFAFDMRLMFENCFQFNGREHRIAAYCKKFQDKFEEKFSVIKKNKEKAKVSIFDKIDRIEEKLVEDIEHHRSILAQLEYKLAMVRLQRIDEETALREQSDGSFTGLPRKELKKPKSPKTLSQKRVRRKKTFVDISYDDDHDSVPKPKKSSRKIKKNRSKTEEVLPVGSVTSVATSVASDEENDVPENVEEYNTQGNVEQGTIEAPENDENSSSDDDEQNAPETEEQLDKPDSEESDTAESMTHDEMRGLTQAISNLPPEPMNKIMEIIQQREPTTIDENGCVEVEIKDLKPSTVKLLEQAVIEFKKSQSVIKPRPVGRGKAMANVPNLKDLGKEEKQLKAELEKIEEKLGMAPKKKPPPPPPSSSSSDSDSDGSSSSSSSSSGPSSQSLETSSDDEKKK